MKTSRFKSNLVFSGYTLAVLCAILFWRCANALAGPVNPTPTNLSGSPISLQIFSDLTIGDSYQMQRRFAWYWTNLPVNFTATTTTYTQTVAGVVRSEDYRLAKNPLPNQAFAVAQIFNGSVTNAIITDGGTGYVTPPTVSIVRGGGTNATAIASISGSGVVTNITITDGGTGYTNLPTIRIASPPAVAASPQTQPFIRLSFPSDHTGWRIQYSSQIIDNWQNLSGSSLTNQINFPATNAINFFRMIYP
jgi:hypothetical protein